MSEQITSLELFGQDYEHLHVADQVFIINAMVQYFLVPNPYNHNQYYITNITLHLVLYTYDLVKFLDDTEVNVKIGYVYTINTLRAMYIANIPAYSFNRHDPLIEEFKRYLDVEINKVK